ncbi:increased loss of mitochondrial DNA protein 1 [Dipodascopsis tothii]|uniref:increased loss of mitochondrial DNA protein 1 n=1 Tax=Dipodascopsis tothii TaxID=44089 RepID=UPI0034CD0E05
MILSAKSICLVHFALLNGVAIKLLTDPASISNHGMVWTIGRAMRLPDAEFAKGDPAVGAIAIALLFLGITDLTSITAFNAQFLEVAVPFRLMLAFTIAAFAYLAEDASTAIANSVVFTFAFLEVTMQFWLYVTLREERQKRVVVQVNDVDE